MPSFEKVLKRALELNPRIDKARVKKAFDYAKKMHAGQYRMSGDPYAVHLLAVADILLSLTASEDTLIAALLHSVTTQPDFDDEKFKEEFGEEIYFLVHAVESLDGVRSRDISTEAEVIRRMFFTVAKDLRVILIKMADRLHNMETLSFRSATKQKQIARETLDIFVPIASRLGMYRLKSRLEDRAFKYLYPKQYEHMSHELEDYIEKRKDSIEDISKTLTDFLKKHDIEVKVDGRVKNLYSIYRKLKAKSHSTIQDIHDVYAFRITLPNRKDKDGKELNDQLYSVLGLIHGNADWKPLPERFKDYIAVPKQNGYQSLHTAVLGLSANAKQPTEIQIRTQRMHDEAEYGIAAHWVYDDFKKINSKKGGANRYSLAHMSAKSSPQRRYVQWIASLAKYQKELESGEDQKDVIKTDYFSDRIFVTTPNGEVKDLPKGATPVDFAYAIHTDVGNCCRLAKVGGKVVPLDYELKNGQMVEIVASRSPNPKSAWLSFVKTPGAKTKIRSFLRSLDKDKSFRDGKELLNKHLSKMGKPLLDEDLKLFRNYNGRRLSMKDRIGLVEEVGNGSVLAAPLLKKVFGRRPHEVRKAFQEQNRQRAHVALPRKSKKKAKQADRIYIDGMGGLPYKIANCCKPKEGQPIVGYVTRGHAVTIHLQHCRLLRTAREERIIDAQWSGQKKLKKYSVRLQIEIKDRVGLIRDIADVIAGMNINILTFTDYGVKDSKIIREVVLEVSSHDELEDLIGRLERIRNVLHVYRREPVPA